METRLCVEIDRSIAEVFDYTNDNVAEWSITCVEDEVIEETPEGVGTTSRVVTEERGKRMEFQGRVTRHEPPTLSAVFLEGPHFDIDVQYTFEDLSGRTRVTQESRIRGKGFFKAMLFLFGWAMKRSGCRAQEDELASLKRHCEERVPLSAGR